MTVRMAPSSLLRASAVAASGVPWVEDGFHLRVKPSPWIGFPIHPFAAWRIDVHDEWRDVPMAWRAPGGESLTLPFDLDRLDGAAVGVVLDATDSDPWIWIEVAVDDRGTRIDVLDGRTSAGGTRIVATRRREPFRFGHTEIVQLRGSGAGTVHSVRGLRVSDLFLDDIEQRRPDLTFGLPLPFGPWYSPDPTIDPRDAAAERVSAAAPHRLSPPDNPTGDVPDDTDAGEEARRILDWVAPTMVEPWLDAPFTDPAIAPVDATRDEAGVSSNGTAVTTAAPVTPSLLTMAVDPQIARYLGLATMVRFEETAIVRPANVWLIASRWAVQRDRTVVRLSDIVGTSVRLDSFLGATATAPSGIVAALDEAFPEAECLMVDIPQRAKRDEGGSWSIVTLLAVAVAAGDAPPDAPDPFVLSAAEPGGWNAQLDPDAPGPESWRQAISLGDQPARGMVGFARMSPGAPVALHRLEPPPGEGFVTRALPLVPNWASNNRRLVADRDVPPDAGGASWRVWQADEFGQWSDPAEVARPEPARPAPPRPIVEAVYRPHADDGSSDPRIPGILRLRYSVPDHAHASPGGRPIADLAITVDGTNLAAFAVAPGQEVIREVAPAPFAVGEHRAVPVLSTYFDGDGVASETEAVACPVYDARPPRVIPTSPVLIWTGQPDAVGQAELTLRWPPRSGAARYRVYVGDARRLAADAGITLPAGTVRSASAKPVHAASAVLGNKRSFTFLGEVGGTPAADGRIHFASRVPASLRSVQFVRVVPLTAGGAEASFSACGLVPVAVPRTDRPPTPVLETAIGPDRSLTIRVRALGMRPHLVAAGAGAVPEYRLRRASRPTSERMYLPVWRAGLLRQGDDGVWSATVRVERADLEPFVRMTWLAEVRYPPEPPIPPGVAALPVDGGIEPVWSALGTSAEALWSDPSLAAESLLIPPNGPAAPAAPTLRFEADGSAVLTATGLPVAAARAVAPFRLEIYRGRSSAASELVFHDVLVADTITWTDAAPVPPATTYDLVVVDPIGRRSASTRVIAP